MSNVKELKEALALGFTVAGIVKTHLKDGFQVADVLSVLEGLTSEANVALIKAAVEGAQAIPAEAQDIGIFEGLELARFVLAEVKKLG